MGNKLSSLPVTEVILEPKDSEREALAETKWLEAIGEPTPTPPPVPEDTPPTKAKEAMPSSKEKNKDNPTGADDDAAQPTLF